VTGNNNRKKAANVGGFIKGRNNLKNLFHMKKDHALDRGHVIL
jgi:hypothetical protein